MCLGIPGQIEQVTDSAPLERSGVVRFGGICKQVNLAYVPEAGVGDYVIVHVGFAISRVDEAEARRVFDYLAEIGDLEHELGPAAPPAQHKEKGAEQ
ncbi:HypC/HybG/HupF family hydrogenase formation chaperone [Microbulbifer yueqingensis]|uniref:Hydrogenase expression/formation protein HypC n=1 Tax=Microbulbifer yueqingensis TaxID=658219 RepID=A0A1G8ZSE6_9GAMM|nr:HypC/HybG/HupF family hydrogenase formation chaperone [Microbulbifer yueqingensis]SDK18036.1 hydrogenase expression/formation protein HypC [Microbulbifer yueqingensis]